MHRTTIMLPTDLHGRATTMARALGISLGELVRQALRAKIERDGRVNERDPLFADDAAYDGPAPVDLAQHHDRHLYGDEA